MKSSGGSLNLRTSQTWPGIRERVIRLLLFSCAALSIVTTVAIIMVLVTGTIEFFRPVKPTITVAVTRDTSASDEVPSNEGTGEPFGQLSGLSADTSLIYLAGIGEYKHPLAIRFGDNGPLLQSPPADGSNRWQMTLVRDESTDPKPGTLVFVELPDDPADSEQSTAEQGSSASPRRDRQTLQLSPGDYRVTVTEPHRVRNLEFFYGTEWYPLSGKPKYGVLPLVWNTVLVAGIAGLFGLPMGLAIAIYLSEYATPRARRVVKPVLEILAGIPTIVYGFFALAFITPMILKPVFMDLLGIHVGRFNALSAGLVVGIMIIPMVSSLSEDVLRAVPRGLREAGYALGATRLDVSLRVVVPAALSGIIAAFLLAVSRAIGETMAVTLAGGMSPNLTLNVFQSIETMTAFIVNITSGDVEVGSAAEKSLYAVGLTLFLMTLVMNILSQVVLRRFREVYQ